MICSCDVMEHLDFLFLSSSGYILLKLVKIDGVLKSKRALLYFYFLLYVFTQCTYIVIRCETYFFVKARMVERKGGELKVNKLLASSYSLQFLYCCYCIDIKLCFWLLHCKLNNIIWLS